MQTADRLSQIRQRLQALTPTLCEIQDDSHLHAGHVGARGGAGHFSVLIRSPRFSGLPAVQRHRLVYQAVGDLMPGEIHALSIKALTPDEA
jgi:BolA family transcriptional regulator, general stress-responsive regulator